MSNKEPPNPFGLIADFLRNHVKRESGIWFQPATIGFHVHPVFNITRFSISKAANEF
jgi:hypothetical protein